MSGRSGAPRGQHPGRSSAASPGATPSISGRGLSPARLRLGAAQGHGAPARAPPPPPSLPQRGRAGPGSSALAAAAPRRPQPRRCARPARTAPGRRPAARLPRRPTASPEVTGQGAAAAPHGHGERQRGPAMRLRGNTARRLPLLLLPLPQCGPRCAVPPPRSHAAPGHTREEEPPPAPGGRRDERGEQRG